MIKKWKLSLKYQTNSTFLPQNSLLMMKPRKTGLKQRQPQYSKLMILDQLGPAILKNEIFSPDVQSMVSYKIQKAFQNVRGIYGNQDNHKKYFKNCSLRKTSLPLPHNEKKVKVSDYHIQPVTAVDIFKLTWLNQKLKSNGKGFLRYPFKPAGIYLLKVNKINTRTRCEICSKLTIKIPLIKKPEIFNSLDPNKIPDDEHQQGLFERGEQQRYLSEKH